MAQVLLVVVAVDNQMQQEDQEDLAVEVVVLIQVAQVKLVEVVQLVKVMMVELELTQVQVESQQILEDLVVEEELELLGVMLSRELFQDLEEVDLEVQG
tara:strand:+ start:340 stop:636 length:297 start_codon:yes stop_codon:yes gene_type:complete